MVKGIVLSTMGMFLALSGVIGKPLNEVYNSLSRYAKQSGGGLEPSNLTIEDTNCCVIEEANCNTSVLYPHDFSKWDESSAFLSKNLNTPVFSFHIHDGYLWMYVLYKTERS